MSERTKWNLLMAVLGLVLGAMIALLLSLPDAASPADLRPPRSQVD